MDALTLNLNSIIELTDEQFFQLCQINELIRFERNPDGTLVLMPLVGGTTSIRNASLTAQLGMWNRDDKLGIGFDSSTGFTLPNGAVRSALTLENSLMLRKRSSASLSRLSFPKSDRLF